MIYIGVTSLRIEDRRDCGYQHNKRLTEAMRKYGWRNIEKTILADDLSCSAAFELEKTVIKELNATNPQLGYNISFGGKSTFAGLSHSDKFKKKMSAMYKGKVYSEETLNRMRNAHAKERHPVKCFDDNGIEIARFISLGHAANYVGGYRSNIARACTNPNKKYKGFYWALCEEVV